MVVVPLNVPLNPFDAFENVFTPENVLAAPRKEAVAALDDASAYAVVDNFVELSPAAAVAVVPVKLFAAFENVLIPVKVFVDDKTPYALVEAALSA